VLLLLLLLHKLQGIGGLGHLGIQFAAKMGYTVVAISRGTAKKELAMELGAHHYIGKIRHVIHHMHAQFIATLSYSYQQQYSVRHHLMYTSRRN
jgi:D-arabinose 1-dehydrogenase-like Zn-dependent alcohol dehydrogenase